MFAVDHAATALLVKRRYPSVPIAPILVSVQAMEFAWVGLNYLGIERTTTADRVRSVADIHLAYMPYSHSVGTAAGAALLAWLIIEYGFSRAALGRAVGLGIASHRPRSRDACARHRALAGRPARCWGWGCTTRRRWRFVEFAYGVWCWYAYRGGPGLLAFICLGNAANLSFLSASIPGPEHYPGESSAPRRLRDLSCRSW